MIKSFLISKEQVALMNSQALILVPAGGANHINKPTSVTVITAPGTVAYGNAPRLQIGVPGAGAAWASGAIGLDSTTAKFTDLQINPAANVTLSDMANQPILASFDSTLIVGSGNGAFLILLSWDEIQYPFGASFSMPQADVVNFPGSTQVLAKTTTTPTAGGGKQIANVTPVSPVAAALSTNLTGTNNDLVFTAKTAGVVGNAITIAYVDPGVETATETVTVSGSAITVTLRSVSSVLSTAAQVKAAIEANTTANALVSIANKAGNDGTGNVIAMSAAALTGGVDGTVGAAGEMLFDGINLYVSVQTSTTAVSYWKAISLNFHIAPPVTLTDGQIKALPTTSVTIIPAPGANKVILPIAAFYWLTWHADYATIDAAVSFALGNIAGSLQESLGQVSGLLASGESAGAVVGPGLQVGSNRVMGLSGMLTSDIVNQPLILSALNNTSGNFTGGDASNVLTVTVLYAVISIV